MITDVVKQLWSQPRDYNIDGLLDRAKAYSCVGGGTKKTHTEFEKALQANNPPISVDPFASQSLVSANNPLLHWYVVALEGDWHLPTPETDLPRLVISANKVPQLPSKYIVVHKGTWHKYLANHKTNASAWEEL